VINDNTLEMFKIGDMSKLRVAANAYEEDVPALESLKPWQRRWKIRLATMPEDKFLSGSFDQIGHIFDPTQKTALVKGWVDNSEGTLRIGQTVTAEVQLPPPEHCVMVPIAALIEDGQNCRLFVQPKADEPCYTCREVTITGRVGNMAYVPAGSFKPDERVVVSGAVELAAALEDLQGTGSEAKTK
jgi:multidrug efflux pump subunit AcrA (membrane-fusion protein)